MDTVLNTGYIQQSPQTLCEFYSSIYPIHEFLVTAGHRKPDSAQHQDVSDLLHLKATEKTGFLNTDLPVDR